VESQYKLYFTGQRGYSPFTITSGTHGNLSSELSIHFGLRGPSHCISTGCTSSTDAFGYAMMHIKAGTCPVFLLGGADAPIASSTAPTAAKATGPNPEAPQQTAIDPTDLYYVNLHSTPTQLNDSLYTRTLH